jgi:tetratricopeptide (TPR) repeat protein
MNWAGKKVSVDQIAQQVYTPAMKGSLQLDMITASRRQGMLAIPIEGFDALFSEISAGHPVIVFENLALSWAPTWHYALVFGYDLPRQTVLMHSGPEAFKKWDIRKFERSWQLADHWGLLVLPPGELSFTAGELAHVQAASALEQMGQSEAAQTSYLRILQRWPQSLSAEIGLANIAYNQKDYTSAIRFLRQATSAHPDSAAAWHNLAVAQGTVHLKSQARQSARQALKYVSAEQRASYQENLGEWLGKN